MAIAAPLTPRPTPEQEAASVRRVARVMREEAAKLTDRSPVGVFFETEALAALEAWARWEDGRGGRR